MSEETEIYEGITEDFVWYEGEMILKDLRKAENRIVRVLRALHERMNERDTAFRNLLDEYEKMKAEVQTLKLALGGSK